MRSLRAAGLSTRAIASATGADRKTVMNDLRPPRQVEENGPPESEPPPVTGLDGKTYQPRATEPGGTGRPGGRTLGNRATRSGGHRTHE